MPVLSSWVRVMGVSNRTKDNLNAYGWKLGPQDQSAPNEILQRSNKTQMFQTIGDCGQEYR